MKKASLFQHSCFFSLIFLLGLLLTGCGFQPRGTVALPSALERIAFIPDNDADPLQRELRRSLSQAGALIVSRMDNPTVIVHIVNEQFTEQITSRRSDGTVSERDLTYRVAFRIDAPSGDTILPEQEVSVTERLYVDPDIVLAINTEQREIESDLIARMGALMMYRFNAIDMRTLVVE